MINLLNTTYNLSMGLPSLPSVIAHDPLPAVAISKLKALVLDTLASAESRRAYGRAITEFLLWFEDTQPSEGFTKSTIQAYKATMVASGASPSSINLKLCALRRLAVEASDNGFLAPETAGPIGRVKGVKLHGIPTGNWLTKHQAEQLIELPDLSTLKGKRDRALLALFIGCGLRREEMASLLLERVQQRDGRWAIVDMIGKGGRVRSVPMPAFAKSAIDVWVAGAGFSSGRIFRPVNKGGRLAGESMTAQSIFETVKNYAARIGMKELAPHDLRRTFAKLAHKGSAPLEQIQLSLGHASIQTTERYLGVKQDLTDAPCDRLGLKLTNG